jgi:hypothetical protein
MVLVIAYFATELVYTVLEWYWIFKQVDDISVSINRIIIIKQLSEAALVCGLILLHCHCLDCFLLTHVGPNQNATLATDATIQLFMDDQMRRIEDERLDGLAGPAAQDMGAGVYRLIELAIYRPRNPTDYIADFTALAKLTPAKLDKALDANSHKEMFPAFEQNSTQPEYYLMVGPDTSDLTDFKGLQMQVATVSSDPPSRETNARLQRYERAVALNEEARRQQNSERG